EIVGRGGGAGSVRNRAARLQAGCQRERRAALESGDAGDLPAAGYGLQGRIAELASGHGPQVVGRENVCAVICRLAVIEFPAGYEGRDVGLIAVSVRHGLRPGVDGADLQTASVPPLRRDLQRMVAGVAVEVEEWDAGVSLVGAQEIVRQSLRRLLGGVEI